MALSDRELAMLDLERSWFRYAGAKETAVLERFGMSMPRYLQVLHALIDTAAALEHDAQLVRRLQRRRASHRARSARRDGFEVA
jgi:hypothetical protein